ncbi:sensor domain-containing diguanylate cyclase [Clostridium sp. CX1]|uniref:sensor domain-containing diguanylate cyclase n=1 Tax=Clostridium sp. CX1 TaxID=2978346 RepID=UPI0021BED44B|nr:sensor domain-containing diguanylate cyclase [Clostridium sp. CX1]MCT8976594.1 sensor domain-containing diguanylate cyclase [Clostridium sp. CX1]
MDSLADINKRFDSRELQIEITKDGIITDVSCNCYHILGYNDYEILNTSISNYFNYNFDKLLSINNFNAEFLRKDGIKVYFDIQATPIVIGNKTKCIYLSIFDISKYKELENLNKMKLKMFEQTKDIVCRLELIPKPKFTYLSTSVEKILGYTLEEHMKNPMLPFDMTHSDDKEIQYSKINKDTDFSKVFQVRMKHKDGYYIWVEDYVIPQFDENNQLVAVESITRNIQDRKELEQRLEKLGYTDTLTGLFNKNYFLREMNLLNTEINVPVGILVCDLDRLKYTNDSLGHSSGDALIKSTGQVLKLVFNSEHVISRTGGDEFVIIIKNKSSHEFQKLYIELQKAIDIFNKESKNIPIQISVGLAYSETSISKMQSTLDIADSDMYKKKNYKKRTTVT